MAKKQQASDQQASDNEDEAASSQPQPKSTATGADAIQPVEEKVAQAHSEGLSDSDTIPMMFPVAVNINHDGILHKFTKGVQRVPRFLEDHWYLEHNGVTKFKP